MGVLTPSESIPHPQHAQSHVTPHQGRLGGDGTGEPFSHRSLNRLLTSYEGPPVWVVLDGIYHLNEEDKIHRELWLPANGLSKQITLLLTGDYERRFASDYVGKKILPDERSMLRDLL